MNKAVFYDQIRPIFGGKLKQTQVDGIEAILTAWDRHGDGDLRKLAYILATAKWETAHTMKGLEEYGRGKGKRYGKPDPVTGKTYYGRGLVQLTWKTNYKKAGDKLGIDLVNNPHFAKEIHVAAAILVRGMMEGWFTKYKLSDWINDEMKDFQHARQIVNRMDKANEIAQIAVQFQSALKKAEAAEPEPEPKPDPEKPAGFWQRITNFFRNLFKKG